MEGTNINFNVIKSEEVESTSNQQLEGDHLTFHLLPDSEESSHYQGQHTFLGINATVNWDWKETQQICMICKLPFKKGETVAKCPMCQSLFHLEHIKEWLRLKGKCPVCLQSLKIQGVIEEEL